MKSPAPPEFWLSDWDEVNTCLDGLKQGAVREVGRSEGGRPMRAVTYGEREPIERRANRFSAQLARHMEDFFDPRKRSRPVVEIISTIHGAEVEGCVSCLNLCSLLETGVDLRGRRWDALLELAKGMRIVLVPVAQPDGRIRCGVRHLVNASPEKLVYYGQGAPKEPVREPVTWEWFLRRHPVPLEKVAFLGGYYNDAGINIDLDDFFSSQKAPETEALLNLTRDETPDVVLVLHTHGAGPFISQPNHFVSERCRYYQAQLGALVAQRHHREGLRPAWRLAKGPHEITYFNLPTALHHVSGALPLAFEFPHGLATNPYTFEEILDTGLSMFEEVLRYVSQWPNVLNGL